MADDFLREMTVAPDADAPESAPLLVVPEHAINSVEVEIVERALIEIVLLDLPPIFIEGEPDAPEFDADRWRKFFDGRSPEIWEAVELQGELHNLVEEKYRERIITARELGQDATQAQYEAACKAKGISP